MDELTIFTSVNIIYSLNLHLVAVKRCNPDLDGVFVTRRNLPSNHFPNLAAIGGCSCRLCCNIGSICSPAAFRFCSPSDSQPSASSPPTIAGKSRT